MQTDPNSDPFFFVGEAGLRRYAEVLIHCGLGHGQGIETGEVVLIAHNQASVPLLPHLIRSVLRAGGHPLMEPSFELPLEYDPEEVLKECASEAQLNFFPTEHLEVKWRMAQHRLTIKSSQHIEPSSLAHTDAAKLRRTVRSEETALLGKFRSEVWRSYTLAYYPTEAMAEVSGMSLETFWQVLSDSCFLTSEDPVARVRESQRKANEVAQWFAKHEPTALHCVGEHIDLAFDIVPGSRFVSSRGGNVPSFEVFGAPVAESVEGWFESSFPSLFENDAIGPTRFTFAGGRCIEAVSHEPSPALSHMLAVPGMDRLGEVAFTDARWSGISTALPGWPLFMENIGGTGHLAFGKPIAKCLKGSSDTSANQSKMHLDFVYAGDFTVTATFADGRKKVIWQDGQFTFI